MLFTEGDPLPGALAAAQALAAQGHRLHYVTARAGGGANPQTAWRLTAAWLLTWNFPVHSLTVSEDNACRPTDEFLDDRPRLNDALIASGHPRPVLWSHPCTLEHPAERVHTWDEFHVFGIAVAIGLGGAADPSWRRCRHLRAVDLAQVRVGEVVRELSRTVPIIILSTRGAERDTVAALDAGADDHVTKPFGMDELFNRPRAALRRDGNEIRLTPTEWGIVELLVHNRDKLVTQRRLLQDVGGPQYGDETNYLRVHMAHIRRKLEPIQGRPRYFVTEPGMGCRFLHPCGGGNDQPDTCRYP